MSGHEESRRAVLVSVEKAGEQLRIRLDDVVCDVGSPGNWVQKDHVTNKLVAGNAFKDMAFDEKELADFGHYVLARLSAFIARNEN